MAAIGPLIREHGARAHGESLTPYFFSSLLMVSRKTSAICANKDTTMENPPNNALTRFVCLVLIFSLPYSQNYLISAPHYLNYALQT